MYGSFEVRAPLLIRQRVDHLNTHKATHPLAADVDIVGALYVVKPLILRKLRAEPISRHGLLRIVLAPALIRLIQCLGAGFTVGLEADIALRLQKLDHIVAAALDRLHILSGFARNAELIVVPNQLVQPLQTSEKDTLLFPQQLVHQKRIVCSACGPVFGGQHDLAAKETVGLVVQGGERTVAEAEEPDIELALVTLNALALHVHFALGRDDGFDIIGLGQGAHVHIIVHHQELVFQIRAAEPVALDLLDAGGVHAVAQQRAHDQPDAAFAFAALTDEHEHFLPLGGGQQAVTQKLLQGGNVLRLQQLGQELQPLFRSGRVRVVGDRQPVVAVALVGGKVAVHEIRSVGNMDAVRLNGQRR